MKELKNLEAIRELLASHPIYTYDYSDGLLINKEDTNIYNAIEKMGIRPQGNRNLPTTCSIRII